MRSDELLRYFDSEKKTRARGGDVETGGVFRAEFSLHETCGRREKHVRRGGRYQNKIDILRFNFRLLECLQRRFCRHVAGEFVLRGDALFFDSIPGGDPFVRGMDHW